MTNKILLLILSLCMSSLAGAQQSFTLQEAIAYARENHASVKGARMDITDAEHRIKEFLAIGLPKVNGSLQLDHFLQLPTSVIPKGSFFAGNPEKGEDPNPVEDLEVQFGVKNTLTAQLEANALLFDGSFFTGLKATRFFKELVQSQMEATEEGLALDVAKAYLGVLVAQRNAEILAQNISNLERLLNETSEVYKRGFAEKLDVDRLTLSLANLHVENERIANLAQLSINLLKFAMGFPMDETLLLSEDMDDLMLTEYESTTLINAPIDFMERSDYVALQKADQLNQLNIKRLKMGYYPSLYAFASYGQTLQGNRFTTGNWFPASIIGLNLSLPIFDGNDKKEKINQATISMEKHRLNLSEFERGMTLEVDNAKINFENNIRASNNIKENVTLAEDIYRVTQIKYREGVGSSLELNQAERELYTSQSHYINSLYDLLVARVELEKALGNL